MAVDMGMARGDTMPVVEVSEEVLSRALGQELRRAREAHGWSRDQLCRLMPSGVGDRTVLSYEHGTRHMTVLRFLEVCRALEVSPPDVLGAALQRVRAHLDTLPLRVDVRRLLADETVAFRPLVQWGRNKLVQHPGGVVEVAPAAVDELAAFLGCSRRDLAHHFARFVPTPREQETV
jgi:transcriptional regulator with XRE-family HTH domain